MPEFNVGIRNLDIVLTFRNLHNIDPVGRAKLNAAAFKALNKNGRYAVVAHTKDICSSNALKYGKESTPFR